MTLRSDREYDEIQRRQALWLDDSKRHRSKRGKLAAGQPHKPPTRKVPVQVWHDRGVLPEPLLPKPAPQPKADRQLCTKCGRRGDLEPRVDVSPCCRVKVVVSDYRGQVRLREQLWAAALERLHGLEAVKRDRPFEEWIR